MLRPTLILLSMSAAASAEPASAQVPAVELAPPGLLERRCGGADPARVRQVREAMPQFRAAWQAEGPTLLEATRALAGASFDFGEAVATLHSCPELGSMSAPLLIDAGRYFEGEPGEDAFTQRERGHFAYTVWHELLHRQILAWLGRGEGNDSALLRRHAGETSVTRAHLHLFALEQLVYRGLGRAAEFHARGRAYGARGNRDYARAYEIVTDEGAEAFVAELRAATASRGEVAPLPPPPA